VLLHDRQVLIDAGLDELRENHVLAVMPVGGVAVESLAAVPGCLRVRRHHNALHAVFAGSAEAVGERLEAQLGVADTSCRQVPLEDLFVELLGADS